MKSFMRMMYYMSGNRMNNIEIEEVEDIEDDFKSNKQAYLINFTAAWCITCQANDKIALSRPKVKQYMKENNIEYIVADWTNKNDEILIKAYFREEAIIEFEEKYNLTEWTMYCLDDTVIEEW